jgi:hypothetical protein
MSIKIDFSGKYSRRVIPAILIWPVMLFVFTVSSSTALASGNVCGDVNYDNATNIGDVVYVISFIFKGGPPPQFLCDGDVNGDGGINIGDAVYLIAWIFKGGPPPVCMAGGGLAGSSGCNLNSDGSDTVEECIVYDYDGEGLLTLTHVNAYFNCCPGEFLIDIVVSENTIVINEDETMAGCDCRCLFDLDMEVHYLVPGEYTIEVHGTYSYISGGPLVFTVDFSGPASGSYCRDYPWTGSGPPSGDVTDFGTCKFMKSTANLPDPPQNQDCLEYSYDGLNVLNIQHLNGAFNCCPDEIVADVSFEGNTIIITEDEVLTEPCYCLCLYDVGYQLTDIPPGTYVLRIIGMNLGSEEPLEVTVDLNANPTGSHCVTRYIYPWSLE